MIYQTYLLLALFLSVSLVSGNNLAACVGAAVGARMVNRRSAVTMGICGYIIGLLLFGHLMTQSTDSLLPSGASADLAMRILLSTVAVFILGNVLRVPLSATSALTGMLVGVSISRGYPIDLTFLYYIVAVWVAAPICSIVISYHSMKAVSRSRPRDIWARTRAYVYMATIASFLTAVAVGANSIALMVAVGGFGTEQLSISIIAIILGSILLSSGQVKRVGSEMYLVKYSNASVTSTISASMILSASLNGIPLSSTQTLSAAVFGAGLSHEERMMATRPFIIIVLGWVIAPLLSLSIGLIL